MTKYLGFKKNKQVDKNTFVMRQIHPNTTDKIGCKTSRKMTFITLYSLKKRYLESSALLVLRIRMVLEKESKQKRKRPLVVTRVRKPGFTSPYRPK